MLSLAHSNDPYSDLNRYRQEDTERAVKVAVERQLAIDAPAADGGLPQCQAKAASTGQRCITPAIRDDKGKVDREGRTYKICRNHFKQYQRDPSAVQFEG